MTIDNVQAASGLQARLQSVPRQTTAAVSPGYPPHVTAYVTAYGQIFGVCVNDHWQPVSNGAPELRGVPLSSLEEWYLGADHAYHVRNDAKKEAPPALDNLGNLARERGSTYRPVIAIDHKPLTPEDRAHILAKLNPGLHEFTVLNGSQAAVIERTVPERGADVQDYVARVPESASAGIQNAADRFKGSKVVGAAAAQVLAEMQKSPDQDAWQEFARLLGQVQGHQKIAVPHALVEKVVTQVAKLSPNYLQEHGRNNVAASARQFIEGAVLRIFADAKKDLNWKPR
jgi:hypothetical protein